MTFYRRNLPHWHPDGKTIFITWRLFGSLPTKVVRELYSLKKRTGNSAGATGAGGTSAVATRSVEQLLAFDAHLDSAKSGPRWLAEPEIADSAEHPIIRGAELRHYELHAYVIMPNHVHVLLDPWIPLSRITGAIKGVAARDANGTLGRTGKHFWQDESFDHWIRDAAEFNRIRQYIEWNPANANLVAKPEDWKWSSARREHAEQEKADPSSRTPRDDSRGRARGSRIPS